MNLLKYFYSLLTILCLGSCSNDSKLTESKKPRILVSIAPYRFIVEKIAGPDFEINTVVPNQSNPHAFEPTSKDVNDMSSSQIWFRIGEPFEEKIIPILRKVNQTLVVKDLREKIEMIDSEENLSCSMCSMDHLDRHIWLSPNLVKAQAENIKATLCKEFPEKSEIFGNNFDAFSKDLDALDTEIREILKPVEQRSFLVSHPAFAYFCKEYELKQLSVEYEGKDPRPRHLDEILKKSVEESANLALALPQYNNKGAQLIAKKLHMPIRYIDPYSADYFETMRKLAQMIADPYAS